MAQYLPESGTIGLGMARNQWNQEGSPNPITTISLGGSQCRSFAGKPSGAIKMSDLYAKYRGWKMQVFSYPAECSIYEPPTDEGGESSVTYPEKWLGGKFVGIGAYQRSVVNNLYPYHEFSTYTLNLGSITPLKFGNVSLRFFGYIRPCSTWYNRTWDMMGFCIQIDGIPDPTMRTYSWNDYQVTSVVDNKYPTYLSISYRRNGSPITRWPHEIRKCGTGGDESNYLLTRAMPKGTYEGHYYPSVDIRPTTNGENGNLGVTCNDAGQPGGNKLWWVPYYSNRVGFNVGDTVEIVDISYWW